MTTRDSRTPDRRVQRTHRLLHDALVSLARERRYETITVTDILERAQVGRSTFYMHFRDKDELLISGLRAMLRSAYATAAASQGRDRDVLGFSLPMLEHIQKHRQDGQLGVGVTGWATIHDRVRNEIAEMMAADLKAAAHRGGGAGGQRIPPDLQVRHIASTFILVLEWWLEHRSTLPARDVNELFRALAMRPGTPHNGDEKQLPSRL